MGDQDVCQLDKIDKRDTGVDNAEARSETASINVVSPGRTRATSIGSAEQQSPGAGTQSPKPRRCHAAYNAQRLVTGGNTCRWHGCSEQASKHDKRAYKHTYPSSVRVVTCAIPAKNSSAPRDDMPANSSLSQRLRHKRS